MMFKKIAWLLFLLPLMAQAAAFVEGRDYQALSKFQRHQSNRGVLITEFFSYGCPWCYTLEAPLNEWVQNAGKIQLDKVPVVFKPDWLTYAKAYYTAKTLALNSKLDPLLFKAIQEEKRPLSTPEAMVDFFVAQGVDKEIAKSAFLHSPTIDMRVNDGMALMANYQIDAVPAFVVNNQYKTNLKMAGSPERLLQILTYLAGK
jgi:thiol:disulfide interchange protein DsbA